MSIVFERPHALVDIPLHYCPGCTHGIIHRIIAEVIDELGIEGTTVGVSPVGCTYNNYLYFNCDMVQAAHGRAPAVATGLKRSLPGKQVFTYQGDGDLAAIGTAEIVHAATRGEKISTIFVNNAIYGMTSGQMAPTTLVGQVTTTELHGYPVPVCEMLSTLEGAVYVERVAVDTVPNIKKAKAAIKKSFQVQMAGLGFSIVEVLSTCPTNWGLAPDKALAWLQENMMKHYPLGIYKGADLEV